MLDRQEIFSISKALIVDDVNENLQVLGGILHKSGIKVAFATNGKQALKSVLITNPDIILLDVNMPEMDGFAACRELKKNPDTADIPVIFLTARTAEEDIAEGFIAGGVDYLTKPYNHTELLSRVYTHLQLRHSKKMLQDMVGQLEQSNLAKDKFLALVSHDLRSPFTGIVGMVDMMINSFDSFTQDELLETLEMFKVSLNTQYSFMENLLQWGNLQIGRKKPNLMQCDLKDIANTVTKILTEVAKQKELFLINNISTSNLIFADPFMMQTVLHNLISNAIKFTPRNGSITVDCQLDGDFVLVKLSDTGVGMNESDRLKLFKLDTIHTTKGTNNEPGSGLGLLLCKEMVEKNGGKISVETEIGKGTTFSFTIPKYLNQEILEE